MLLRIVFTAFIALFCSTGSYAASPRSCLPGELKAALHTIESKWGSVEIVSTFRKNALVKGRKGHPSFHRWCRAVDFAPRRGTRAQVLRYLRNWKGGLGTYSGRMHHLHIDNGPRRRWHTVVR